MSKTRTNPTWFDRMVGWFDPERGYKRLLCRHALAIGYAQRGIEAASGDRGRADWSNITQSADAAVSSQREQTRNIVRQLVLNNPHVASGISRLAANIVGAGIRPQCHVQADTTENEPVRKPPGWQLIDEHQARHTQEQAETWWAEFAENCDIGERRTFYDFQEHIERALSTDGEAILRLTPRSGANRFTFGLELIEADRLATGTGQATNKSIHDGVELDPVTSAPIAYHILREHPGSSWAMLGRASQRIPRLDDSGRPQIFHLYRANRPEQTRGYPPLSAALRVCQDIDRYWEAEIMAARIGACYSAFIESPVAYGMQAAAGDTNDAGDRVQKMQPGQIWYGMPGEKVSFGNPQRPNATFGPFTEILLRAIGVAQDLPFELIALDFSKTNYSSARASLLEARRSFQVKQEFHVRAYCRPIWEIVTAEGIAKGEIEAPGFSARRRDYLASLWVAPSWGWVDPVKEETAARETIKGYLSTHSEELAAQGRDFDATVEQCAREHKRLKELGLPSPWDPPPIKNVTQPPSAGDGAGNPMMEEEEAVNANGK